MKIKKMFMYLLVGLGIIGVLCFLFLITLLIIGLMVPTKIDSTNKYLKTKGYKSDFIVFPKTLNNMDNVIDYHYYDYHLRDGCEIILKIKYDSATFDEELLRLESIQYTRKIDGKTKKIVKDDEKCLFNYFTYVSIYDTDKDVYEYACIDFEKFEITYIYLGYLSLDYVMINYDFLPKKYLEDNQFLNEYNFDIYSDTIDIWIK